MARIHANSHTERVMQASPHTPLLLALLASAGAVQAQTVTVTTSFDDIDIDYWTGTVADLPGPDGKVSFPEALRATDNTPGHQTIEFAIPPGEWWLPTLFPGQVKLQSIFSWTASDSVTIDGTTQTAFTGDTFPGGWEISLDGLQLYLHGDGSTLRGFHGSRIYVSGSGCLIEDNTGGMHIEAYGGSGSTIRGNEASLIKFDRSNDNVVVGNTVNQVRIDGWFGGGQPALNNRIGGPNPGDRNVILGSGSFHEGKPNGNAVELFDTGGTILENNYIGTTPDGLASGSTAATIGIHFKSENQGVIVRDNLIAGILGIGTWPHYVGEVFGTAIYLEGTGGGHRIQGNTIGLNANGEPLLGSVTGIDLGSFNYFGLTDVQVGGPNPGEGNIIAGHLGNGIVVGRDGEQLRITGNSIHGNGALGIELVPAFEPDGPTPNDPLDADTGGSGLQNFPAVASATVEGSSVRVAGTLDSSPRDDFTLEFFASPACDPSGFGEGELFLGSAAVSTGLRGLASFDVSLDTTAPPGWFLTATATLEPIGATSEFSACVPIGGLSCQPDLGFGGPGTAVLSVCGDVLASGGTADLQVTGAPPFLSLIHI